MSPRSAAVWYGQLASLTRVGITIPEALRTTAGGPGRKFGDKIATQMEDGADARAAWEEAKAVLGATDALLLAAGQLSGTFPDVCERLATRHTARDRVIRKLISGAAYPLIMAHLVAFLSPLMGSFSSGCDIGACAVSGALAGLLNVAVIWVILGAGFWVAFKRPTVFAALVRPLPLWGSCLKNTALANFAGTLAALLRAGVLIGDAWAFAGEAAGDVGLRRAGHAMAAVVEDRRPPGPELPALGVFPDEFCALYHTGERTGRLEAQLDKLATRHEDLALAAANTASIVYPVFAYGTVALFVAARVLSGWAAQAADLNRAIDSIR